MAAKSENKTPAPEAQLKSFIDRLDPKNQKLFRSARAAVRKRFPTANELAYDYSSFVVIGYSPNENGIDSVVSLAGRPEGVQIYFNQGPRLPDPKKLLQGSAKTTRFIWLESAERLAHPDVEAFTAAAVELSGARMPSTGKGSLIIKTNKMTAAKKKTRPKAKAKK
jgi:hypothetical protein